MKHKLYGFFHLKLKLFLFKLFPWLDKGRGFWCCCCCCWCSCFAAAMAVAEFNELLFTEWTTAWPALLLRITGAGSGCLVLCETWVLTFCKSINCWNSIPSPGPIWVIWLKSDGPDIITDFRSNLPIKNTRSH